MVDGIAWFQIVKLVFHLVQLGDGVGNEHKGENEEVNPKYLKKYKVEN